MTWVWGYGNRRRFGRLPVSGGLWCERLCCCCGVSQVKWSGVEPKMHAWMPPSTPRRGWEDGWHLSGGWRLELEIRD